MAKLIILSGIPGSGKSTYARSFAASHKNTFIVASDDIRADLFGRCDYFSKDEIVWDKFEKLIIANAKDDNVVIADSSATDNARRLRWATLFRRYFKTIELVYFDIPFDVCLKRNEQRDPIVPYQDMLTMKKAFKKPSKKVIAAYDMITYIAK